VVYGDIPVKNRIRLLREMHGMTQEGLAEALGVHRQTILATERGKFDPSLDLAFRIARYFDVSLEEVFIWEEPDSGR
jgi:putative transcriptional regulator